MEQVWTQGGRVVSPQAALVVVAALLVVCASGEAPARRRFSPRRSSSGGRSLRVFVPEFLTPPPPSLSAFDEPVYQQASETEGFASESFPAAYQVAQQELSVGHSEKYEVPAPRHSGRSDDHSHSRDGPANYEFSYQVLDEQSDNEYGHQESRQGEVAQGSYYVLLPDGRRQVVDYQVDENGYRPVVRYEDSNRGGYPGARSSRY